MSILEDCLMIDKKVIVSLSDSECPENECDIVLDSGFVRVIVGENKDNLVLPLDFAVQIAKVILSLDGFKDNQL